MCCACIYYATKSKIQTLQIVSDVNLMRSVRSRVRVYVRRIDMCDVFLLMRFNKGQFWIERETCFCRVFFFFFFLVGAALEKFFGISLVRITFVLYRRETFLCDDDDINKNKNSAISEKIVCVSLFLTHSLSLLII